jgi:hypothetical protein
MVHRDHNKYYSVLKGVEAWCSLGVAPSVVLEEKCESNSWNLKRAVLRKPCGEGA